MEGFEHGLDFYFSNAEHRENWKSNINQLLVAFPPLTIDDTEC